MNFAWQDPEMEKKGQITRSTLNSNSCVLLEKRQGKETPGS